jgi:hypothetical protein
MSKTSSEVYLPALKAKAGEFGAIQKLSDKAKSRILPMFEVLPVPLVWPARTPKSPLETHLDSIRTKIAKCWGKERPFLIDFFDLPLSERTSTGAHPVSHFFSELEDAVSPIPVTGLDRDDDYNSAISAAVAVTKGAAAIRLLIEDIELPAKTSLPLSKMISHLGVVPQRSYLILDFRELREDLVSRSIPLALASLRAISRLDSWKATVVLASGMGLDGIRSSTTSKVHRTELDLWKGVLAGKPPTVPLFGDYGVVNPEFTEPIDPRKIKPSAKIRYTRDTDWVVLNGSSYRKNPKQFHQMASGIVSDEGYAQKNFSWGDSYIAGCAKMQLGPGNLTTWVQVDVNHHIELVSQQIANLLAV